MTILDFGSLNIDRVFRVPHLVRPGETIASHSCREFAGGKGANQSVALARAGAQVAHAGKVGPDGRWLLEKLTREHVDTSRVLVGAGPTGQAIIQVDDAGQNAIVLLAGANRDIAATEVDHFLADFAAGDWLLVQNETSCVGHAIRQAHARGMRVAFNPAPFDDAVPKYPLESIDLLCVNASEGAAMTGHTAPSAIVASLGERLPGREILLTLGPEGGIHQGPQGPLRWDARRADVLDTTAAGDTFLGYYLAARGRGEAVSDSLELAVRAAAICVARAGAMDSIPHLHEVLAGG